jgi:hypothetical protein
MKLSLTVRTGYAWGARVWGFHAITLHVTMDTRVIMHDFEIS